MRTVGQEGQNLRVFIPQREPLADVRVQLFREVFRRSEGSSTARPNPPMTGFEKVQRQLLFTSKMLIERGIREAALLGNVADAGRSQPAVAEKL